jgi:hypothetical protein
MAIKHVEICTEIPEDARATLLQLKTATKDKADRLSLRKSHSVPTPMKDEKTGVVRFTSEGQLTANAHDAAKIGISRCVLHAQCPLPDSYVEDLHVRESHRLIYQAGYKAGVNGAGEDQVPTVTVGALDRHARAGCCLLRACGHHMANVLDETNGGNPSVQCQSDIVTLGDHRPYLSHGSHYTYPRSHTPLAVASGFSLMLDGKSNQQCATKMDQQSMAFFGRPKTSIAHSYVSDGAAKGVVDILNSDGADTPPSALQDKPVMSGRT